MRFVSRCEVEGCSEKSTHLVIDWALTWLFSLCEAHKDAKMEDGASCTATPIVELPAPE